MNYNNLPSDLAKLERALRAGGCEPGPALRERVMASVSKELRRSKRLEFWQYTSTVAASVLLVLNLSFSAATTSSRVSRLDRNQITILREQVDQMQLGLSADEIKRQCLLIAAAGELVPYYRPYGSAHGISVIPDR